MTAAQMKAFHAFFMASFAEGLPLRELRLSAAELEYIAEYHPNAVVKPVVTREYADGKLWFEVSLRG
ncbi:MULTISPECIES: hypothetical protein [Bacillales]|uniref:hypothetical protein n=1 Tax=Bacillales TaxID=1385 RepID=UPI0006A75A86|nr:MULTISPECIES: hypothetical protein [Bacillales]OBZ15635.1 hypothetical protein A7975_30895 [Bacillus sp. FJAT-26390]